MDFNLANSDYDASVFLVTDEGQAVMAADYEPGADPLVRFVMLTNDVLNPDYGDDNTIFMDSDWHYVRTRDESMRELRFTNMNKLRNIYIDFNKYGDEMTFEEYLNAHIDRYRNDFMYPVHSCTVSGIQCDSFVWQIEQKVVGALPSITTWSRAVMDFGGYRNTMSVLGAAVEMSSAYMRLWSRADLSKVQIGRASHYFPAFTAAYDETLSYGGRTVHGYLPAAGQLMMLYSNIDRFNAALRVIDENHAYRPIIRVGDDDDKRYVDLVSSTQRDDTECWMVGEYTNGHIDASSMTKNTYYANMLVIPFYKISL